MVQHTNLTELRDNYLLGKISKKQFEGLIFQHLVENYERYHLFRGSLEDWQDLLTDLYPRISKAIDSYEEVGATFDSYIRKMIHWSYKEKRHREASHHVTEYTWWYAHAEELLANSPEPEYTFDKPAEKRMLQEKPEDDPADIIPGMRNAFSKQQILILFLKSYYFITEDIVSKVAEEIGMKKEELWGMVEKLRAIRKKREEEIREIEAGIECQYYRCLTYQKRLLHVAEESSNHYKLAALLDRAQKRLQRMRKRLKGVRFDATNCQIADVLNLPKGTVDSSLYSIRKKTDKIGLTWEKPLYSKRYAHIE